MASLEKALEAEENQKPVNKVIWQSWGRECLADGTQVVTGRLQLASRVGMDDVTWQVIEANCPVPEGYKRGGVTITKDPVGSTVTVRVVNEPDPNKTQPVKEENKMTDEEFRKLKEGTKKIEERLANEAEAEKEKVLKVADKETDELPNLPGKYAVYERYEERVLCVTFQTVEELKAYLKHQTFEGNKEVQEAVDKIPSSYRSLYANKRRDWQGDVFLTEQRDSEGKCLPEEKKDSRSNPVDNINKAFEACGLPTPQPLIPQETIKKISKVAADKAIEKVTEELEHQKELGRTDIAAVLLRVIRDLKGEIV